MTVNASLLLTAAFFSLLFKERSIITDLFISDDCRIVIKLTNTVLINYWHILSSVTLHNCINSHIHITVDQNIITIKIAAIKQLKSDNLTVYAFTVTEKESLQSNIRWITSLEAGSKIVIIIYDVIVHSILIQSIKMKDQWVIVTHIQTENHKIEAEEDILINYVKWLCSSKWAAESVMMKFINAEHINLTL